jgi:hypothetical protein
MDPSSASFSISRPNFFPKFSHSLFLPSSLKGMRIYVRQSPLHAVRSTCKTFRRIVNELPFWMEDGFDITEINHFSPIDDDISEDGANSDIFYGDDLSEGEGSGAMRAIMTDWMTEIIWTSRKS